MRLLSARAVHLGEPEAQYRDGDPDLGGAVERLTGLAGRSQRGLAAVRDRRPPGSRVRQGGGAPRRDRGRSSRGDAVRGLPLCHRVRLAGLGQRPAAGAYLDAAFWLAEQLADTGLDAGCLTPMVTKLSAAQRDLKTAVIAGYKSQAAALKLTPDDLVAEPAKLDFELAWRMPLNAAV